MSHHVARAALDQGLLPDTISSDLHAENIDSVLHGLPSVMDKFLAFGLSINDVLQRVTEAPARALRRPELGSLEPGNPADLTVFSIRSCDRQVQDAVGDHLRLSQTFIHRRTFVAGQELAPIDDGRVESRSSPWATRFGATIDNRP